MTETVFVIGAGASCEVGLPTGEGLKSEIASKLKINSDGFDLKLGDRSIHSALKSYATKHSVGIQSYLGACEHISEALPLAISIDNFIDAHRGHKEIELCGKLGIVRSILAAEQNSYLIKRGITTGSCIDLNKLSETWYNSFFQILTENCRFSDLYDRFSKVTLIVFNYDRCIEYFLLNALKAYYRVDDAQAADLILKLNIYHPYGQVGVLPQLTNQSGAVTFGSECNPERMLEIASEIRTFTEGADEGSSAILNIRNQLAYAERLVFIGFAFHELNMQLIAPAERMTESQLQCFATTFGISDSDKSVIKSQIRRNFSLQADVSMSDVKCSYFFNEYRRSLAFKNYFEASEFSSAAV